MNVSTKWRQDHKYFGNIKSNCFNKEVGEAFYALMMNTEIDSFNAQKDMPVTQNKLNAIAERLCVEYKFLKDQYIFRKRDITGLARDLYNEYAGYCAEQPYKPLQYTKFTTKLKEVNIDFRKSGGVYKYNMKYHDLKAISDKYHWVHELDEFVDDDEPQEPEQVEDEKDKIIKNQESEIELLKAEIEKLKRQLDPLEKGINKDDQKVVTIKATKKPTKKVKTIVVGETNTSELEDDLLVDQILACFD